MDKREIARRSDALYYSGSDGINRRWLCDKVAELEHELERLRDQERDAEHEESVACDRVRKAEAEADRLRKLVVLGIMLPLNEEQMDWLDKTFVSELGEGLYVQLEKLGIDVTK